MQRNREETRAMITQNVVLAIEQVRIKRMIDNDPDTSYLGRYTDDIGPGVVIRKYDEFYERIPTEMERDSNGRFIGKEEPDIPLYSNEYVGFRPANHIPHNPDNWKHVSRADKKAVREKFGSLKKADYAYALEDYNRFEGLTRGDWYYIGIEVDATVSISVAGRCLNSIVVQSGGLWGIESDSGDVEINDIISDEKESLRKELQSMGFPDDQIDAAFKGAVVKSEF